MSITQKKALRPTAPAPRSSSSSLTNEISKQQLK